ncbi:MAG: hypothetical protein QXQ82_02515 [Candidatus Pacearchaeota archaeon]
MLPKKEVLIFLVLIALLTISAGCKNNELVDECRKACRDALSAGRDLSEGPCLLDPMSNAEWVCDIAHKPREAIDNLRENQCNAWHNGTAKHFIELTPNCELIKIV